MAATSVITVYKNGDNHFKGKKVVINRKQMRNFETFLDKVTRDTCSRIAIRRIYTPTHGSPVKPELSNLLHGGEYVAAGPEKFRRLQYGVERLFRNAKPSSLQVKPQLRKAISSRYRKEANAAPLRNRIIFVSRNGESSEKALKLLLDKRMLGSMEVILQHISNKLKLATGPVGGLHTVDGIKIEQAQDINTNTHYVAVSCGKPFIVAKYKNNHLNPVPTRKNYLKKKYQGTFVGLPKQRKHKITLNEDSNVNPLEKDKEIVKDVKEDHDSNDSQEKSEKLTVWQVSTTDLLEGDANVSTELNEIADKISVDEYVPETDDSNKSTEEGDGQDIIPSTSDNFVLTNAPSEDVTTDQLVFNATGIQKEIGEEIQDDAKTKIEKTIDMLPAATVEENLDL